MKHLKLMTTMALTLAMPVLADDHGRGGGRGREFHESRGSMQGPARGGYAPRGGGFGVGVAVTPRPAYPVYAGSAYGAADPYYNGYSQPAYPSGYPQDSYGYSQDPNYNGSYVDYAPYAPPPAPQENCGPAPGPGYVFVNGFWQWGGNRFTWSSGQWMRPPNARASWTAGGWFQANGRYGFRRGFWR